MLVLIEWERSAVFFIVLIYFGPLCDVVYDASFRCGPSVNPNQVSRNPARMKKDPFSQRNIDTGFGLAYNLNNQEHIT